MVTKDSSKSGQAVIQKMADLLARQKLVPFFGAGISRQHLGVAAAELAHELANRLGARDDVPLSEVSDEFVDRFGESAFINFLREKLLVKNLDDSKVPAHHLLLSLSPNTLYTTNQDNLFELTAAQYGRPYRRVVTLQDISDAAPGERLLYKYHGDLDHSETLVFTRRSYLKRMGSSDHPLDIRMRSDLLGKKFLFLGFSFRDENVAKLLDSVKRVFDGQMPPSYLVAYEYDQQIAALQTQYGIHVLDPLQLLPDARTNGEAFQRCLASLCNATVQVQSELGLGNLLSDQPVNPRIVTEYEIDAVALSVQTEPFQEAVNAFRGALDHALVPVSLQDRVLNIFESLVNRVDPANDDQMGALKAVLFNLYLPGALGATAMACVMATFNRRPNNGFDWASSLASPSVPDNGVPVAAAMAVMLLRGKGNVISDNFRARAMIWFRGVDEVPELMRKYVEPALKEVWPNGPPPVLSRSFFPTKGFHQITDELQALFAKQFRRPG